MLQPNKKKPRRGAEKAVSLYLIEKKSLLCQDFHY